MQRLAIGLATAAAFTGNLDAQSPLLADLGEVVPDGIGQLVGAADYEGDGDVDLFSTVGVFLNDGGFFTPGPRLPITFDPSFNVRSIAIGDFDGDGRVDYLVGRAGGQPAGIAMFTAPAAAGEFVAILTPLGGATDLIEFDVADFDGDGDLDVVAAPTYSSPSGWVLLNNDGVGGFTAAPAAQWPGLDASISFVAAGDFDGDGLVDVYGSTANGERWRRNLGGGAFGVSQALGSSVIADSGVVGDFNGDGFDEVYVVDVFGDEVVHPGSVNGLQAGVVTNVGPLGAPPVAVDRDGDGFEDLVRSVVAVSGSVEGTLEERRGGPGGLGAPMPLADVVYGFGNPTPFAGMAVADVDGDGDDDTLLVPGGMSPITLLNDGAGGFAPAHKNVPAGVASLIAPPRDVDGDGDLDLVSGAQGAGTFELTLHRNEGGGRYAAPVSAGSVAALAIDRGAWADFDGDGDDDLLLSATLPQIPAVVAVNDGSGSFVFGAQLPDVSGATAMTIGDFSGDGLPDLVVGRAQLVVFPPVFQQPLWIENASSGAGIAFQPSAPFGVAEIWRDVAAFDDDLDGDLDLLVAVSGSFSSQPLARIYHNNGTGAFAVQSTFSPLAAVSVAVGDLDGDLVDDLVLGGQVWQRQGSTYVPTSSHPSPRSKISLVDLDEDGDLDLFDAVGSYYPGDGAGGFGAPIAFVPYEAQVDLRSGGGRQPLDLDGDGDLDAIGPSRSANGHFARYSNRLRHVAPLGLGTPGQALRMQVSGPANELWALGLSWPAAGGLALPPFGTLFLDPNSMFVLNAGVMPVGGEVEQSLVVPTNGGGFAWAWQALVGNPLRLTNGVITSFAP